MIIRTRNLKRHLFMIGGVIIFQRNICQKSCLKTGDSGSQHCVHCLRKSKILVQGTLGSHKLTKRARLSRAAGRPAPHSGPSQSRARPTQAILGRASPNRVEPPFSPMQSCIQASNLYIFTCFKVSGHTCLYLRLQIVLFLPSDYYEFA